MNLTKSQVGEKRIAVILYPSWFSDSRVNRSSRATKIREKCSIAVTAAAAVTAGAIVMLLVVLLVVRSLMRLSLLPSGISLSLLSTSLTSVSVQVQGSFLALGELNSILTELPKAATASFSEDSACLPLEVTLLVFDVIVMVVVVVVIVVIVVVIVIVGHGRRGRGGNVVMVVVIVIVGHRGCGRCRRRRGSRNIVMIVMMVVMVVGHNWDDVVVLIMVVNGDEVLVVDHLVVGLLLRLIELKEEVIVGEVLVGDDDWELAASAIVRHRGGSEEHVGGLPLGIASVLLVHVDDSVVVLLKLDSLSHSCKGCYCKALKHFSMI